MNKYKHVVLGMALLTSAAAFAQSSKSQYTSIGPVLGFGHSWVSTRDVNFKPSPQLGISVIYSRFEHWGWGGLMTISHEGVSYEYIRNRTIYTNIDNPVYLRTTPRAYYFFGKYTNPVRAKVFLGPSLGVKLVDENYNTEPSPMGDAVYRAAPTYNTLDFGANVGAGVNVKLAKSVWLNLDADYYHGLTNANDAEEKNRNIRTNVGVMFGF